MAASLPSKLFSSFLLGVTIAACSLPWSSPSTPTNPPSGLPPSGPGTGVTGTVSGWTAIAAQWWWMGLVLLIFLPQVRAPLAQMWSAIFSALSVPFLALRSWWDSRSGGGGGTK